jgi:NAD(P)-dependent dehydrogenase (short-subunit alcohol dehydrogenase family)
MSGLSFLRPKKRSISYRTANGCADWFDLRDDRHQSYGGAGKAAVRAFARTWANELAPRNIRVNVVSTGPVDTAMFDAAPDEVREALTKLIPLGRLGRPEEVAAAALLLASDESSFMTGAELCIDGSMAQA